MITIDCECANTHRFEGCFKDHGSYQDQHNRGMISCPVCGSQAVKRIFTGCSINTGTVRDLQHGKHQPGIFDFIRAFNTYVTTNFDYVGRDFAHFARAIHYGIEEKRNIYGESSAGDIQELRDEGIDIVPLLDIDRAEN